MAVTPKGIVTPDSSSPYNLITDLNTLASTTDTAITNASNLLKGTAAQRVAFTSTATNGMLWQDTDSIKMIWRKDGAEWVPAVWRWSGTSAQRTGFTQAPNGFEWYDYSTGITSIRSGSSTWVPRSGAFSCHLTATQPINTGWTLLSGFTVDVPLSGVTVSGSTITFSEAGTIQFSHTSRHAGPANAQITAALTRNSTSNPGLANSVSLVSMTGNTSSETKIIQVTANTVFRLWMASSASYLADTMTALSVEYV